MTPVLPTPGVQLAGASQIEVGSLVAVRILSYSTMWVLQIRERQGQVIPMMGKDGPVLCVWHALSLKTHHLNVRFVMVSFAVAACSGQVACASPASFAETNIEDFI